MKGLCDACGVKKTSFVKQCGGGRKLDIHSLTGKPPKHKNGWTPPVYKYMGPYNPLDKQLEYNTRTQEKYWSGVSNQKNKVDEISAQHDICYDMGTADSSPIVSLSVSP